jgi:hypothetical protein
MLIRTLIAAGFVAASLGLAAPAMANPGCSGAPGTYCYGGQDHQAPPGACGLHSCPNIPGNKPTDGTGICRATGACG